MDSFGFNAHLHHTAHFPLLGKDLEVRSNSADAIRVAHQTFGHWLALPVDEAATHEALRMDVIVMAGEQNTTEGLRSRTPMETLFEHRLHGHTFIASAGHTMLTAQLDRGYAIAFVDAALAADAARLQKQVLDTLGLLLATQRDRQPIHAGAVVWQGRAILLAGQSKAGKSTLCYACARAGFELMAEDVVYIQREPAQRVWGHSACVHLLSDAPCFFAELRDVPVQQLPNGKAKLVAPVAHTRRFAEQAALCILSRHPHAHTEAQPLNADEALAALFTGVDEGFDLYPHARDAAAHLLLGSPCYRLHVGHNLDRAVELIKTL